VLIGCAVGPVFVTPSFAAIWRRSHGGGLLRTSTDLRPFFGAAHALSELAWLAIYAVCASFLVLFVLFALRQVLRREWAAIVAGALLVGVPLGLAALPSSGSLFLFVSYFILYFFLLARAGLVAMIATNFAYFVLTTFPFTWPATTWYSGIGYVGVTVVAALAITAFRVATVGNTPARRTPA
jgi:hypothetical protein